jgi:hypothetical protein
MINSVQFWCNSKQQRVLEGMAMVVAQEWFEQQNIAFGYFLRPDAAAEERVYQELPASAAQIAPLLESYLEAYNNRFNTNLDLGKLLQAHVADHTQINQELNATAEQAAVM